MSTTPKYGMTEIDSGTGQQEIIANENFRKLEQGAVFFNVLDKDLTSPPGSPSDGDAYIVGGSATGDWSGKDGQVAFYHSTEWLFLSPVEGWHAWVVDESIPYRHNGTGWVQAYNVYVKHNFAATAAPTVNDDTGEGYGVGSKWYDTTNDEAYVCLDASSGAAVWIETTLETDELGTAALEDTGKTIGDIPDYEDDGDGNPVIDVPDKQAQQRAFQIREVLTANRDYYVRTDGSDTNDGLTDSAGGAFATIQKAVDVVAALDLSIYDATINVGDGTYTNDIVLKTLTGAGTCYIEGNTTTPSNVLIDSSSPVSAIQGNFSGRYDLRGMKLQNTGQACLRADGKASYVAFRNLDFGSASNYHIRAVASFIEAQGGYTISAGSSNHYFVQDQGLIRGTFIGTITLSGTPAFTTAFAAAVGMGTININSGAVSFSGSATGKRYSVSENSLIRTVGGGATYLPGDAAGTTATGGQYT